MEKNGIAIRTMAPAPTMANAAGWRCNDPAQRAHRVDSSLSASLCLAQ